MKTIQFTIKGLDCAECALPLEKHISNAHGVKEIKISYSKQQATIIFNDSETNEAILKREIKSRGFSILESEAKKVLIS